jgi:glycerol-3-phosphate acyltransferase PlsY
MNWALLVLTGTLAYLIGSLPTAYLVCKRKGLTIFEIGSGNMGATNVARALGLRYAVLTWVIDCGKGTVAVLIGRLLIAQNWAVGGVIAAIAAIIGHNWSIFVMALTGKLRGGKGAAIAGGTWLLLAPVHLVLVAYGVFSLIVLRTRIVSLAVLATVSVSVLWMLILVSQQVLAPVMAVYAVMLFALIFLRHRSNIERLLQGTERRIGQV